MKAYEINFIQWFCIKLIVKQLNFLQRTSLFWFRYPIKPAFKFCLPHFAWAFKENHDSLLLAIIIIYDLRNLYFTFYFVRPCDMKFSNKFSQLTLWNSNYWLNLLNFNNTYPILMRILWSRYNLIDAISEKTDNTFISLNCLIYKSGTQNVWSGFHVNSKWSDSTFSDNVILSSTQYTCKKTSNEISCKRKKRKLSILMGSS